MGGDQEIRLQLALTAATVLRATCLIRLVAAECEYKQVRHLLFDSEAGLRHRFLPCPPRA